MLFKLAPDRIKGDGVARVGTEYEVGVFVGDAGAVVVPGLVVGTAGAVTGGCVVAGEVGGSVERGGLLVDESVKMGVEEQPAMINRVAIIMTKSISNL